MTGRRRRQRVRITPDGWFVGSILALCVVAAVVFIVIAVMATA
ncbi:hypothetical protein [Streptomyces sp. YGL11-2]